MSHRSHGVMVSTLDSESSDPSSNLGGTSVCCLWWFWRDIDAASEFSMTILSFRAAFFSISFKASLIATSSAVIMLLLFVIFLFSSYF